MRAHPPIWVWLVSVGLILTFVAYLQLTTSVRKQVLRHHQYPVFKQQLENFLSQQTDSSQCKVICWGSSMTSQAIDNSTVMRDLITSYGQDIDVQKIYMLGANAKVFPFIYEFFDATERLKPNLICIEDNLFSHTSQNFQHHKLMKEFNYLLSAGFGKTTKKNNPSRYKNKNFDTFTNRFEVSQGKDTLITPDLASRTVLSFSDNELLNEQLHFILEQQIPLVIFNIPRAGSVQKLIMKPDILKSIDKQIEDYRSAGFQIEYWEFPNYLPFKYYRDYTHMNSEGRAVFTKWLTQKIAEKLADQCQ